MAGVAHPYWVVSTTASVQATIRPVALNGQNLIAGTKVDRLQAVLTLVLKGFQKFQKTFQS